MKNSIITSFMLAFFGLVSINAQSGSSFGIKGGLNYGANGNYFESIDENAKSPDSNMGYHIGIFGKIGSRLYVRPELVYTSTKSGYGNDELSIKKIDAPILVGIRLIGPLSFFIGPSLQYILDTEFDGIGINTIEKDFSVGLNFGFAVNLNKIGIDLRYERGLSANEATFIGNNTGQDVISRIDTRPNQVILSLTVVL